MRDSVLAEEYGREEVYSTFIQQKKKNKCFPGGSECISDSEHIEDSVKGQESPDIFVMLQHMLSITS